MLKTRMVTSQRTMRNTRKKTGLSQPAFKMRSVDVMRALCGLCAELGGTILVHGSPDQRVLDPGDEENCRKRGAACFAAVADAARDAGVTYCVEPLARNQTAFINTVEEAADIVRQIDSPHLR